MNDSIYEEYMRSVLGYQPMNNYNTYDMNYDNWETPDMTAMNTIQMQELENCYPDIYRIVYPMIQRACSQNTRTLTRELVDNMTNEIYFAVEDNEMLENRNKEEKSSKSSEDRQVVRNQGLNDLIRILILRELLGRPGFPSSPGRPPRPRPPQPRPPRPPMRPPMGPPMGPPPRPQPRPGMGSFNRMSFEKYDDLYE